MTEATPRPWELTVGGEWLIAADGSNIAQFRGKNAAVNQKNAATARSAANRDHLFGQLVTALKPLADFADYTRKFPADMPISAGSPLAKRQLTMGDCYEAVEALARVAEQEKA